MAAEKGSSTSSSCSWIHHSYKRSFSSLTSILFSLFLPTTALLLLAHPCHGKGEHFYLDLPSKAGFACPEVNSFVDEFDPFYRWALSSSLPYALSATTGIDIELANSMYQQASAWRVISNWTDDDDKEANELYASAEPHIAGGHMKQHRRNWQWRMQVSWGISIRMCLSIGNGQSNRSCLWTTPVISMENEPDLSLLFVGLPYRDATAPGIVPDLKNMPRSTTGYYLSNYASNARTDFIKYQKLDTSSHYYLTSLRQIPKCAFSPSYYSSDATAYLAFPSIQCGCSNSSSTQVCIVVTKNMDTNNWGLFDYRSSCDSLKSYWAWNTGGNTWIVYVAHNTSSDKAVPFTVTFKDNNGTFRDSLIAVLPDDLRIMANITACVEAAMQQSPVPSEQQVINMCDTDIKVELRNDVGEYYLNKMRRYIWAPTPPENNISSPCRKDLPRGQLEFKDKLCVTKLDSTISAEMRVMIQSMLHLRDTKFKQNKLWKDGLNNRQEVYAAILSVFLSFLGTCIAATSHKLQDIEEWFEQKIEWFKKYCCCCICPSTDNAMRKHSASVEVEDKKDITNGNGHEEKADSSKHNQQKGVDPIKFGYRVVMVIGVAVLVGYTTYSSVKSVKKDRDILQAQTVPQVLSDGTVVLLTTTATYEIKPLWPMLYVICVITGVIAIITLHVTWYVLTPKRSESDKNN